MIFRRNCLVIVRILIIALFSLLIGILLPTIIPSVIAELDLDCIVNDQSGDIVLGEDVTKIRDRLRESGLNESSYMGSTGIQKHIQRLCDGEVTVETLQTYADHLDKLAETGRKYGQIIPPTIWDVQTRDMRANNLTEYDVLDLLINSDPDYMDLLVRAYNRFYSLKQNNTPDTALDVGLDILLYSVDFHVQRTDTQTSDETGKEIIRVWQQIIENTPRINPLTDEPLFPYNEFAHLNVTDMWRHHINRNTFIGEIWGVSGFDERFIGDIKNTNQVEHLAVSASLQYVYGNSILMLNAFEIRDMMSGRQDVALSEAGQNLNTVIATQFLPYFQDDYVSSIAFLRCLLSSNEQESTQCS